MQEGITPQHETFQNMVTGLFGCDLFTQDCSSDQQLQTLKQEIIQDLR